MLLGMWICSDYRKFFNVKRFLEKKTLYLQNHILETIYKLLLTKFNPYEKIFTSLNAHRYDGNFRSTGADMAAGADYG